MLDKIIEWAKGNPGAKVYNHVIRRSFEPYDDGKYREQEWSSGVKTSDEYRFGDMVWYIDIYWQ